MQPADKTTIKVMHVYVSTTVLAMTSRFYVSFHTVTARENAVFEGKSKHFVLLILILTHTHTLFTNTQQTCMKKMQMTITKEKKITTHT